MGFLQRSEDDVEELARIREGGLPDSAQDRLTTGGSLFSSGLSVREFALLGHLGPEPLAQVMGASVVRPGWQYLPALPPGSRAGMRTARARGTSAAPPPPGMSGYSAVYTEPSWSQGRNYQWHSEVVCELEVLSDAWNTARRRALERLREEASRVGADAVVGVGLERSDHDLGHGVIEYTVLGTAIRVPGADPPPEPTLTDLSVQDFWRLRESGFAPAGLVAATAVTFGSPARSTRARRARTTTRPQELTEVAEAFQLARQTVRRTLTEQVRAAHASTAVGVEFAHVVARETLELGSSLSETARQGWHLGHGVIPYRVTGAGGARRPGWMVTMHAAGTAIRPRAGGDAPTPKTMIGMRGR